MIKKYIFAVILSVCIVCQAAALYAEEGGLSISPIKSVPKVETPELQSLQQEQQEPLYENMGMIQRVGKDESGNKLMVIDDRLRYYAKGIQFFDADGGLVSSAPFYKGKTIGYNLNAKKQIIAVYLIAKP